jgi:hypothetical protein
LEWLLKQGARCICIRPAPVPGYRGTRSMGIKEFDPFWARVNEANIFVAIHAADTGYERISEWWGGGNEWTPFAPSPFFNCLRLLDRAISDTISALICHGMLERHPNVRILSVENGAFWVEPLIKTLEHVYGQMPQYFKQHPVETFRKQVFVAPFIEDSFEDLAKHIDVSRILFGSDYPHPEGAAEPLDFLAEITAFNAADQQKIMSSNLKGLTQYGFLRSHPGHPGCPPARPGAGIRRALVHVVRRQTRRRGNQHRHGCGAGAGGCARRRGGAQPRDPCLRVAEPAGQAYFHQPDLRLPIAGTAGG